MSDSANAIQSIILLLQADDAPVQIETVFGDRMYPMQAPDDAQAPYLTYYQLEEDGIDSKDGFIPTGWVFEVEITATSYLELKKGARAVRAALVAKTIEVPEVGNIYLTMAPGTGRDDEIIEERNFVTMSLEFSASNT